MSNSHRSLLSKTSELLFRGSVVSFSSRYWRLSLLDNGAVPDGPCFIYGNHSNNYDPFMLNAFTSWGRSTAGVMTMEYMEDHPLAKLFASVGIVGTRKHIPEPGLIRRIYRLLNQSRSVVIYPEGGRRWDGRPEPWIETTAKLFIKAGVPVYPILTHGSYVGWPRWARYPRPARIQLEVGPPVQFSQDASFQQSLELLKSKIAGDENVVSEAIRPKRAFMPAIGIDKLLYRDPESGVNWGIRVIGGDRIESVSGALNARVLPDSRIQLISTGEKKLTGDLYAQIKSLPYQKSGNEAYLSSPCQIRGRVNGEYVWEKRTHLNLYQSHVSFDGKRKTILPLEALRHVDTEKNDKLSLHSDNGYLSAHFAFGGSVLQWKNELHAVAPNVRV